MSTSEQYRPLDRGTIIASRYEVEKYLGESLIGPTYVVRHVENHKLIALKFIRVEFAQTDDIDRVRKIIKDAKSVNHPNVVRYGKVGEYRSQIFFTQEYFPSKNLRQEMLDKEARSESFSIREVTEIASEVLQALTAINTAGICHTNLKPENILIRYKTTDQGAKMHREIKIADVVAVAIIGDSNIAETPYRAPECWEGGLQFRGTESDVYSMGNILYELLIGKPASGTYLSPTQLRDDLPSEVDTIIDIALSANPSDRYKSPEVMLDNIRTYFSEELIVEGGTKEKDRTPMYIGVAVVIVVLIVAFSMIFNNSTNDAKNQDWLKEERQMRDRIIKLADKSVLQLGEDGLKEKQEKNPGMVYIPKGPVLIGSLKREFEFQVSGEKITLAADGENIAVVERLEGYYIDRFEWPNPDTLVLGEEMKPEIGFTQEQAAGLCEKQGKRLCTSSEWEKACKGYENYVYSYGDSLDDEICSYDQYRLGKDKDCKSSYGTFGMSAGPREWTATSGTSENRFLTKGGAVRGMGHNERSYRCAYQSDESGLYSDKALSFRCCLSDE